MSKDKKKSDRKPVKGIIVSFTLESLRDICHTVQCEKACYGSVAMAHTVAMDKILIALAKGKDIVII